MSGGGFIVACLLMVAFPSIVIGILCVVDSVVRGVKGKR